jgi:cytoplasmic tRNA 2-thiolation protein 2
LIANVAYCIGRECFFPLTAFKFRRSLEPSINLIPDGPRKKALKPSGHLAIGFSGGVSSSVLLDLVDKSYFASQTGEDGDLKGGRDHPRNDPTRVWKKTAVIYVEQAAAYSEVSYSRWLHLESCLMTS